MDHPAGSSRSPSLKSPERVSRERERKSILAWKKPEFGERKYNPFSGGINHFSSSLFFFAEFFFSPLFGISSCVRYVRVSCCGNARAGIERR